jgi:hypothetical protein
MNLTVFYSNDDGRCTLVSAFFPVDSKHNGQYLLWFENTLVVNAPLVFFSDVEHIAIARKIRGDRPTVFIESNFKEFATYKFFDQFATDPVHVPSKELAIIWHEKFNFLKKAAERNPFKTERFAWMDAGQCVYREKKPPDLSWPDSKKMRCLPVNRLIVTSSSPYFDRKAILQGQYCHFIAATSFIINESFIDEFNKKYYQTLESILKEFPGNIIGSTEQCVMSHMYAKESDLFYLLGHGYGVLIPLLY